MRTLPVLSWSLSAALLGALSFGAALGGCASGRAAGPQPATEANPATPEVGVGAITPDQNDAVNRMFMRKAPDFDACWSAEYQKTHDRSLQGDITVEMLITPAGQATHVHVLQSTLKSADVESCVVRTIAGWAFPQVSAQFPYTRTIHLGAAY